MKKLGHILDRSTHLPDPIENSVPRVKRKAPTDRVNDMLIIPIDEDTLTSENEVEPEPVLKPTKPKNKGRRKLNEQIVRSIREHAAAGMSKSELAKIHNVTPTCIWNIVKGNTWKHVI